MSENIEELISQCLAWQCSPYCPIGFLNCHYKDPSICPCGIVDPEKTAAWQRIIRDDIIT